MTSASSTNAGQLTFGSFLMMLGMPCLRAEADRATGSSHLHVHTRVRAAAHLRELPLTTFSEAWRATRQTCGISPPQSCTSTLICYTVSTASGAESGADRRGVGHSVDEPRRPALVLAAVTPLGAGGPDLRGTRNSGDDPHPQQRLLTLEPQP
jgi:hypothetical protein